MRILIDLQAAQTASRQRGIGRYALALIQALLPLCEKHEVWIALNRSFPDTIESLRGLFEDVIPESRIVTWSTLSFLESTSEYARRQVGEYLRESFIARFKPDIVYVPSFFEGFCDSAQSSVGLFGSSPTAIIFYDLIPLLYKDHYFKQHPRMLSWYERKLDNMKRAHLWLAISESSRQDAIHYLNLPEEWVLNVSAAAAPHFKKLVMSPEEINSLTQHYDLVHPFVMCAASIEYHKNLQNLLMAYAALPENVRKKHQLMLVCSPVPETEKILKKQISEAGLSLKEVMISGYVSDDDLVKLYNICSVLILPSLYEGFGLPALEAMSCGAAVIGSNTSSIPEVIGRQDALFNPLNVNDITDKLHAVLTQPDFRKNLQEHGLLQAKKFSWDVTAQRTLEAFERLHAGTCGEKSLTQFKPYFTETSPIQRTRPRLAYFSPLPPEKTGIADYSAELLGELTRHYAIDVITDQKNINSSWVLNNCSICSIDTFKEQAGEYEGRILYHIGNSIFHVHMFELLKTYPGIIVLHDFFLSSIFKYLELNEIQPNVWTKALYESHGYAAVLERTKNTDLEAVKLQYPANFDILKQALGIITHSTVSQSLCQKWYGDLDVEWQHIPLLRTVAPSSSCREKIRAELGFNENDFIICSFGFLDVTKLNKNLLDAWLQSSLSLDLHCHLIFVGANCADAYGLALTQLIDSHPSGPRITITGFVSEELYQQYLIAADAAVQLRTMSRGETSRAVLDCLAYQLPTIINAHGTMADYPETCVYKLPDVFAQTELENALVRVRTDVLLRNTLKEAAIDYLKQYHHPRLIAEQYYHAIENLIYNSEKLQQLRLMKAVTAHPVSFVSTLDLAQMVVENHPAVRQKQIFIDLSGIMHVDLKTGIERVVRGYLNQLLKNPPHGYRIEPVYLNGTYFYARAYTCQLLDCSGARLPDEIIEVYPGDIFLCLDLIADKLTARKRIFEEWRNRGVLIYFMLYDLLPILNPGYFPEGMSHVITEWLTCMASVSHGAICISRTVADELVTWLDVLKLKRDTSFKVGWLHLAANIQETLPTSGCIDDFSHTLNQLVCSPCILSVGTVEPRKGHAQSLEAFELLWEKGSEINWVIVGRLGWNVEALGQKLNNHPEKGKRLFWFEKSTDEMLLALYEKCQGVLMPSNGEGFGLPLIEAAQHRLPILARDLPVFREVAGEHATYFSGTEPSDLAIALETWVNALQTKTAIASENMPWLTWAQSTEQLLKIVLSEQWYKTWKLPVLS